MSLSSDGKTCSVSITSVERAEVGQWTCIMQSKPDENSKYQTRRENTKLVIWIQVHHNDNQPCK